MVDDNKRLIILYGKLGTKPHAKQQRMIDGGATCGYREYARLFGEIIYLCPQTLRESWEKSISNADDCVEYISNFPDAIVWSVKHDPEKDEILRRIPNRILYYSCCNRNMYNEWADISLVDTKWRLRKNARLWFKGKDSLYWVPLANEKCKWYDYLLIGPRGDKNEREVIDIIQRGTNRRRTFMWIGGDGKIKDTMVDTTPFMRMDAVRSCIGLSKVGICFTEHPSEGFPQSILEMTMCGLPVVYNKNAPMNSHYKGQYNIHLTDKKHLIETCESLLANPQSERVRQEAVERYDIRKSWKHISEDIWK